MFSAFFIGAAFLVSGLIGWDVRHMSGAFKGGRWVDAPVWWELAVGGGLLLLAGYWARRIGAPRSTFVRAPQRRIVKYVGRGTTYGAEQKPQGRLDE